MRCSLALITLLSVSVQFNTHAQVLDHLPAIDDSEPQALLSFIHGGNGLYVEYAIQTDAPGVRFRALTNYYELGGWSAAQRTAGAATDMYRSGPWVSELWSLGWDPLPYEVEGLAWIPGYPPETGHLIASAWVDEKNASVVLEIDEQTGAFEALATLPEGLRFSGLGYSKISGLAGVTRDLQTDASEVYLINAVTWTVEHLVDLPAPCEALGGNYSGWIAGGERVFLVIDRTVIEMPVEPFGNEVGTIVALGDWFSFSAVEPATWGRIKRQYR